MGLDKQNVWQLPAQRTSWNSRFLCVLLGLKTYCWEPNLWITNNMCSSCETYVIYFGMWNTVKKNLLLDTKPALIFSCENFCEFMGSYFLFACIAVMQCFLQTLERFCSTMLKIWHVDAWTLNFKFILSA